MIYPQTKLILPEDKIESYVQLQRKYEKVSLSSGIFLSYYRTTHIGNARNDIENYCIEIEAESKRVLFTGDAAANYSDFSLLRGKHYDIVVVTPLFFHDSQGRAILSDFLCVEKVLITHIPQVGENRDMFLKMAELDKRKWDYPEKSVVIAREAMMSIEI